MKSLKLSLVALRTLSLVCSIPGKSFIESKKFNVKRTVRDTNIIIRTMCERSKELSRT